MDEERNVVQTVLKANNTFKDFSLSAFRSLSPQRAHTHTHTHEHTRAQTHARTNKTFLSFGGPRQDKNNRRQTEHARDGGVKKKRKKSGAGGGAQGIYGNEDTERLSGRTALEQSGACVCCRWVGMDG